MTRHYMAQWRANRKLLKDPCECGQGPRIAYEKGCAQCEAMDQERYRTERTTNIVRRKLARFDMASMAEIAQACDMPVTQVEYSMRRLVENGEVDVIGAGNATEYRIKQRRAA